MVKPRTCIIAALERPGIGKKLPVPVVLYCGTYTGYAGFVKWGVTGYALRALLPLKGPAIHAYDIVVTEGQIRNGRRRKPCPSNVRLVLNWICRRHHHFADTC